MQKCRAVLSVILFFFALAIATHCFAEGTNWYAEDLQAEFSGNYSLALENYIKSAEQGLADAKFAFGRLYRDIFDESDKSFNWFLEAAKQGNSLAQYEVGLIYLNGSSSILSDTKEAKNWFLAATSKGSYTNGTFELYVLNGPTAPSHTPFSFFISSFAPPAPYPQ